MLGVWRKVPESDAGSVDGEGKEKEGGEKKCFNQYWHLRNVVSLRG